jgi:phosphoribosylanthranilate isomerase
MIKVKICGITTIEDAFSAVEAGADLLGFVFAKSPRRVDRNSAARITSRLPGHIRTVGVFVDASPDEINAAFEECGLHIAQLHGQETPQMASAWATDRVWKALRVRAAGDLDQALEYRGKVGALLLDAYSPVLAGGTGAVFDWGLATGAKDLGIPIVLAGGLRPGNVTAAISQVRPDILDVSTGVEMGPGRKDPALMRAFITEVRQAEKAV